MSTPFLGEIKIVAFDFAPQGWALCNGQPLPINQNQALFSLLGTMYGGDGQTTFALPNLRGRVPMHLGNGHIQGESAGAETDTVVLAELAAHNHALNASGDVATAGAPSATRVLAQSVGAQLYGAAANFVAMEAASIATVGASQPHENRQPYLVLNFCVALIGVFPSRN